MYDNIGGKIKILAKCIFVIDAIAMFVVGIVLLSEELIGAGLLTMFLGPVLAWVSSWLLYGFGELIDKASEIAYNAKSNEKNTKKIIEILSAKSNKTDETQAVSCNGSDVVNVINTTNQSEDQWKCPSCGKTNLCSRDTCWSCGLNPSL